MRINARKIVVVKCNTCGKDVRKFKKEYDRQTLKRGQTKFYCDNKCSYRDNEAAQKITQYSKDHPKEIYARLVSSPNFKPKRKDAFTPFRLYISKIKQRMKSFKIKSKILDFNIDAEFLEKLWEKQKGTCPYTGLKMELRDYSCPSQTTSASLDRIDSNQGYTKDNVEFVCMSINYAKNEFTKQEILNFIQLIRNGDSSLIKAPDCESGLNHAGENPVCRPNI